MKRLLLLLAVSAAASLCGLLPWQSHDAAELLPVQTLLVDYAGGQVYLRADGGLEGVGDTLAGAMDAMADEAPGELFFGQVTRVVAGRGAAVVLLRAGEQSLLRLNTAVYQAECAAGALAGTLESLEPYWQARESRGALTTLLSFCADGVPPQQLTEEGRAWTV